MMVGKPPRPRRILEETSVPVPDFDLSRSVRRAAPRRVERGRGAYRG